MDKNTANKNLWSSLSIWLLYIFLFFTFSIFLEIIHINAIMKSILSIIKWTIGGIPLFLECGGYKDKFYAAWRNLPKSIHIIIFWFFLLWFSYLIYIKELAAALKKESNNIK